MTVGEGPIAPEYRTEVPPPRSTRDHVPRQPICDAYGSDGLTVKRVNRSKHVTVMLSFVRSLLENGTLQLQYLESKDMLADLHTKPLLSASLVRLTTRLLVSPQA